MKFFGTDIKEKNLGYFGIRKCNECDDFVNVDLVEIAESRNAFFIPFLTSKRRFLTCEKCGAAFEINDELWNYYKTYPFRFTKETTDEILVKLKSIKQDLDKNNVNLKAGDDAAKNSLEMIFENLCNVYGNPKNIEELVSVFFLD